MSKTIKQVKERLEVLKGTDPASLSNEQLADQADHLMNNVGYFVLTDTEQYEYKRSSQDGDSYYSYKNGNFIDGYGGSASLESCRKKVSREYMEEKFDLYRDQEIKYLTEYLLNPRPEYYTYIEAENKNILPVETTNE